MTNRTSLWLVLLAVLLWWGCEIGVHVFGLDCPPPIPVIDVRNVGTPADTVGITQGCPYVSVDFNGDSTFVDFGRQLPQG